MCKNSLNYIRIANKNDLKTLLDNIDNNNLFSEAFIFEDKYFKLSLLKHLNIDDHKYDKKYYYFDYERNIHISDSHKGYTWISTYGLASKGKASSNNLYNSLLSQHIVVTILFDKVIQTLEQEEVYGIDNYHYNYLNELTPGLFHNVLFYIELFCKVYISLNSSKVKFTHKLSELLSSVTNLMFKRKHNDSLFHAKIIKEFDKIVKYVASIPGSFKEEYVKYDDNSGDSTIVIYNLVSIHSFKNTIDMSFDFINDFYYNKNNALYLKTGLLERLLNQSETSSEKKRVLDEYGDMIKINE